MIFITDPKCATLFYFASTLQNPKNFYRAIKVELFYYLPKLFVHSSTLPCPVLYPTM